MESPRFPQFPSRAALAVLIAFAATDLAAAAVRLGDAVPGVIKKSDLARIKRQLDLEHFSVVAAVWLGATEGREAILVEPLADADLAKGSESCRTGPFFHDRLCVVAAAGRTGLI